MNVHSTYNLKLKKSKKKITNDVWFLLFLFFAIVACNLDFIIIRNIELFVTPNLQAYCQLLRLKNKQYMCDKYFECFYCPLILRQFLLIVLQKFN